MPEGGGGYTRCVSEIGKGGGGDSTGVGSGAQGPTLGREGGKRGGPRGHSGHAPLGSALENNSPAVLNGENRSPVQFSRASHIAHS